MSSYSRMPASCSMCGHVSNLNRINSAETPVDTLLQCRPIVPDRSDHCVTAPTIVQHLYCFRWLFPLCLFSIRFHSVCFLWQMKIDHCLGLVIVSILLCSIIRLAWPIVNVRNHTINWFFDCIDSLQEQPMNGSRICFRALCSGPYNEPVVVWGFDGFFFPFFFWFVPSFDVLRIWSATADHTDREEKKMRVPHTNTSSVGCGQTLLYWSTGRNCLVHNLLSSAVCKVRLCILRMVLSRWSPPLLSYCWTLRRAQNIPFSTAPKSSQSMEPHTRMCVMCVLCVCVCVQSLSDVWCACLCALLVLSYAHAPRAPPGLYWRTIIQLKQIISWSLTAVAIGGLRYQRLFFFFVLLFTILLMWAISSDTKYNWYYV